MTLVGDFCADLAKVCWKATHEIDQSYDILNQKNNYNVDLTTFIVRVSISNFMKCTTLQVLFHEHNHGIILLCKELSMCGVSLINGLHGILNRIEWKMECGMVNAHNYS